MLGVIIREWKFFFAKTGKIAFNPWGILWVGRVGLVLVVVVLRALFG